MHSLRTTALQWDYKSSHSHLREEVPFVEGGYSNTLTEKDYMSYGICTELELFDKAVKRIRDKLVLLQGGP